MKNDNKKFRIGRRGVLGGAATVAGGIAFQSLATGIPAKVLLDPLSASAEDMTVGRMLILSNNLSGDPVNANVPGTYGFSDLYHPPDPSMNETPMTLSGQSTTAAAPWASLAQDVLDQTVFFHHATYTPVHGELGRVQRMLNETDKNDMMLSHLSREIAPFLGTVQADPVSLGARGGELLSSEGRVLGNVSPLSVRQALGGVEGPLKGLTAMRDAQIDRIYKLYKRDGTSEQRRLLDDWARSRDEVRNISTSLLSELDAIDGNNQQNQLRTAAVLCAMKITPVVTVRLSFGGDNHADNDLARETTQTVQALADINTLMNNLAIMKTNGILDTDVIFASLNVFGRTLKRKGITGRDHNSNHHCLVMSGPGLKGGVVGGVELNSAGNEYIARSIDSVTGEAGGSDIPFEETLASAGKTLGAAMGVPQERLDKMLPTGKIVASALS